MKKFILTVFLMLFTTLSANATTHVFYGNTGHPVTIRHGANRYVPTHNFGANVPRTRIRATVPAGQRTVARPHQRTMATTRGHRNMAYNPRPAVRPTSSYSAPSRFNKNYTVSAQRSYTRNGVTYYN